MLKCAFIFQDPRGACFLFVGRDTWPNVYLASALYYDASEKSVYDYVWALRLHSYFFLHKKYVDHGGIGTLDVKHWIGGHQIFLTTGTGI